MARDFADAGDRISWSNIYNPAATNRTLSMWMNPDSANQASKFLFQIPTSEFGGEGFDFMSILSGRLEVKEDRATIDRVRNTLSGELPTGWNNYVVTLDSTSNGSGIHMYRAGTELTYDETIDGTGLARAENQAWIVGGEAGEAVLDGKIAEVAFWDRVLTSDEISELARGLAAYVISNGLRFYAPLAGSNFVDMRTGTVGTNTGTDAISEHPKIYQRTSGKIYGPAGALPPATTTTAIFFGANF